MAYKIEYDQDGKLMISGLECSCSYDHTDPEKDIYVGSGLIDKIPGYIARRGLGTNCVLVADNNTYEIAGRRVSKTLKAAGFKVIECVIVREGKMEPDERAVGEVLLSIQPETQFLVAVGSGSITDTTRVNAERTGLPFVSVGTAPSMDGYTSAIAPLTFKGLKIHRKGPCPEIIVCDTEILKTAPLSMVCSGVGDVLGKYIAKCDWKIGNIINDEPYCHVCGEIVTDAIEKLLANVDEIREKTDKGMKILVEALLLAGVTVLIIGNTRAVASVEHNIAHYWEMMQMLRGKTAPGHGSSVGVATLLAWPMFTRFAGEDLSRLDLKAIKAKAITREQREKWMLHAYGKANGEAIMEENPGDFLTWEEQERRIRRAQERFDEIKAAIDEMPKFEDIYAAMKALGADLTAEDCGVDEELLITSMHCAKDYRTRYTLFKLLDECGLLEDYLKDYPLDYQY
ncbi:MAG: sn-glycerol-1-phosphate dehydrogenase [Clostridia bacterium]|nr:sn-glycerol-1-phosphate dehydrogenase [Clostridia bacterium]